MQCIEGIFVEGKKFHTVWPIGCLSTEERGRKEGQFPTASKQPPNATLNGG
jgi:hypothetical protein